MSNLKYIEELGIGSEDSTVDELDNDTSEDTEETQDDLSNSDNDSTLTDDEDVEADDTETEKSDTQMSEVMEKITNLEKRIADKDKYINELREQSKKIEAEEQGDTQESDEDDFWSNPDKTIKELQDTVRVQQMQIQETIYANTVDGYWKTVNPTILQEAVATDRDFAKEFNQSREPYKTAYEYLKNKADGKSKAEQTLRESIRQELLKEMNVKEKKEVPPNINSGGKSGGSKKPASEDGFASVFGR